MKRRYRPEDEKHSMEMTPMIDVTFLLLVFFLCTLRFKTLEGQLAAYLPPNVGSGSQAAEQIEPITITLTVVEAGERRDPFDTARAWSGTGRYELVGRTLRYRVGPASYSAVSDVAQRVADLRAAAPDRDVKVAPDTAAIHGDVVALVDALRAEGVSDVVFRGAD